MNDKECENFELTEERELTEEEISKLTGEDDPNATEEERELGRAGYMYCNDLYKSGNIWKYKRDKRYAMSDTRTTCGNDSRWMDYNPGDSGSQLGHCKNGRWAYKLSWK